MVTANHHSPPPTTANHRQPLRRAGDRGDRRRRSKRSRSRRRGAGPGGVGGGVLGWHARVGLGEACWLVLMWRLGGGRQARRGRQQPLGRAGDRCGGAAGAARSAVAAVEQGSLPSPGAWAGPAATAWPCWRALRSRGRGQGQGAGDGGQQPLCRAGDRCGGGAGAGGT